MHTALISLTLATAALAGPLSSRATSDNWCGSVLTGTNITSVDGTWVVPNFAIPTKPKQSKRADCPNSKPRECKGQCESDHDPKAPALAPKNGNCPANTHCVVYQKYPDGECPSNGKCVGADGKGPAPNKGHCPPGQGLTCIAPVKPTCDDNGDDGLGGDESDYHATTWVGIDGYAECGALLQAGTGGYVSSKKPASYYAWYEFYPNNLVKSNLRIFGAGDRVYVNVTATSKTSGTIYIENQSKGTNITHKVNAPAGKSLCYKYADWIHEDLSDSGGKLLPFPKFSDFSMTGSHVKDNKNKTIGLGQAKGISMINVAGHTLCTGDNDTKDRVTFRYKGSF